MKRIFQLMPFAAIGVAGIVALSVHAGCASDEEPTDVDGRTAGEEEAPGTSSPGQPGSGKGEPGDTPTAPSTPPDADSGGGDSCPVGQAATIADVADGTVASGIQVDVTGAIATTKKLLLYYGKSKGTCLWGVFVKDPNVDRGMMVISYGDNAPENSPSSACPTGTDAIPNDAAPGDVLDIVGRTDAYAPSSCSGVTKQTQVKACSVEKKSSGAPPAPVVVSDLDGLASGLQKYQGLLVKVENVDAENYDGGTVGPYGVIELQNTELQVNDNFYYPTDGGPEFGPSQHFNYIIGISHLSFCDWVLQPRDKCNDFDPKSTDCL